jgi:hypothetical protein
MTTGALTWREPRALGTAVLRRGLRVARAGRGYMKAATLAGWRFVPATAGAGLVSAGLAMRFGAWTGLVAGGVFALIADYRMP